MWTYYFWTIIMTHCFCHKEKKKHTFLRKTKQTVFQSFPINTSQKWQQIHKPICKHFLEFLLQGRSVVSLTISGELYSKVERWQWDGLVRAVGCVILTVPFSWGASWEEDSLFWPLTSELHLGDVIHVPFSLSPEIKSQWSKCTVTYLESHTYLK